MRLPFIWQFFKKTNGGLFFYFKINLTRFAFCFTLSFFYRIIIKEILLRSYLWLKHLRTFLK